MVFHAAPAVINDAYLSLADLSHISLWPKRRRYD